MKFIATIILLLLAYEAIAQTPFPVWNPFLEGKLPEVNRKGRAPNQKFKACCRKLPDADPECKARFCDFEAMSSNLVGGSQCRTHLYFKILVFLATCNPRGPTVGQIWDCASSCADHQECCRIKNVQPGCMAYCETTHGVPTDVSKYLFCFNDFNKIRDCFKYYLEDHPNLKGDF